MVPLSKLDFATLMPSPDHQRPATSGSWKVKLALGAAVVLGAGALAFWWWRRRGQRPEGDEHELYRIRSLYRNFPNDGDAPNVRHRADATQLHPTTSQLPRGDAVLRRQARQLVVE